MVQIKPWGPQKKEWYCSQIVLCRIHSEPENRGRALVIFAWRGQFFAYLRFTHAAV